MNLLPSSKISKQNTFLENQDYLQLVKACLPWQTSLLSLDCLETHFRPHRLDEEQTFEEKIQLLLAWEDLFPYDEEDGDNDIAVACAQDSEEEPGTYSHLEEEGEHQVAQSVLPEAVRSILERA